MRMLELVKSKHESLKLNKLYSSNEYWKVVFQFFFFDELEANLEHNGE